MIKYLKKLGPGLLFAGSAVGVSHLVQSTKAGANFGFGLIWALVLINIIKFPFFEFGPRYAAATGETGVMDDTCWSTSPNFFFSNKFSQSIPRILVDEAEAEA